MTEEPTDTQADDMLRSFMEGKHNVHTFLHNVAKSDDTTKTGYLEEDELGLPNLPIRTHQELAVFCEDVAGMEWFAEYFKRMSEITTSTSLSKKGFLIKAAITTKKELADVTPKKKNKGWFKKKQETGEIPE